MTSYFSACDVTFANSNHKNFIVLLTCTCAPHFENSSATHAYRLPVKQMLRTWIKSLLHCGYKCLLILLVIKPVTSLGHLGGEELSQIFETMPNGFKLFQHIFPVGAKKTAPSLVTGLLVTLVVTYKKGYR